MTATDPHGLHPTPPPEPQLGPGSTLAGRFSSFMSVGGALTPILTAILAFFAGGLIVLATGKDPISTYQAIFEGTGLQWLLPWTGNRATSAINLQQTLLLMVPLMLLGYAVAYAFRAG